ncbi:MAG: glycine cleavage system aminomethyltransferase GcvT [Chitinophagales bacterium]|nr:glycine cleavage system aminomethyltransferase GcvT [Chitinophagales bacterium]MCO5280429.1 glycine cleavage system aminomethyltransferase GcvT [Chitinophagales bacterium]OJV25568.1 MAG: glycine cleavage system protein T [Bacteroidetes bacterium 37-13]HRP38160.1 glycine cleavage system aminomethyltransferase GcvT [Chitinophagales bacterium]
MKNTALTNTHIALGAKMVPFAGYNMPVTYSGLVAEHNQVRNSVGVFDVSHMGEFSIKGEKALELIQLVTTNDASKLANGKIQYTCITNNEGGIVDDLLVYRFTETEYFLVVNASNIEKDWNWIAQHNSFGAEMENVSEQFSLLAVQGPNGLNTIQKLTEVNLSNIPYYSFANGKVAGIEDVIISNTGYTGAGGFELYIKNADAQKMWDAIFDAGKEFGILPCGLGCRDTLRLEKAFCLYGHELNDTTSPIEAGLGWITKFSKHFVNDTYHKQLKENGVAQKLVGFEVLERGGIPRQNYLLKNSAGETIGKVTSGTQSPSLNKPIGLAYVQTKYADVGTEILLEVRDKLLKTKVVKTPFL